MSTTMRSTKSDGSASNGVTSNRVTMDGNTAVAGGQHSSPTPAPPSISAVAISRCFIAMSPEAGRGISLGATTVVSGPHAYHWTLVPWLLYRTLSHNRVTWWKR